MPSKCSANVSPCSCLRGNVTGEIGTPVRLCAGAGCPRWLSWTLELFTHPFTFHILPLPFTDEESQSLLVAEPGKNTGPWGMARNQVLSLGPPEGEEKWRVGIPSKRRWGFCTPWPREHPGGLDVGGVKAVQLFLKWPLVSKFLL